MISSSLPLLIITEKVPLICLVEGKAIKGRDDAQFTGMENDYIEMMTTKKYYFVKIKIHKFSYTVE